MLTTKIALALGAFVVSCSAGVAAERAVAPAQNHESLQTVRMARDVARSTVTGLPASEPTIFGHAILETTYSLAGQGRKAANR